MQGSLILNPLHEKDQTHKPVKWHALKPNTMSTGQLQILLVVSCVCNLGQANH
jgi:hypothetical protein